MSSSLFDRWSFSYDNPRLQENTYRPIHDAMLERLVDDRAAAGADFSVLDLGCGTGQLTVRMSEQFEDASIVAADLSAGMLAIARDRLVGRAPLVRADAQLLPFQGRSFDAITCSESFHWYPDQSLALSEAHRVLRPGGRLHLASIAAVTGAGERVLRMVSAAARQPIRALPPRRLAALARSEGFEIAEQFRLPRRAPAPWPVLTVAVRSAA